jgi:hypothetical protein
MFALLILGIATVIAGLALQRFWPDYDSRQNTWGARCILLGAVAGLFALGWCVQAFAAHPAGMAWILGAGVLAFFWGLLGAMAAFMSPTGGSDGMGLTPYLLFGGAIVALFAFGGCCHTWAAGFGWLS